ncbi:MAG: LptA/OstA family protein [Candidatus Acidiferrales bacterium]
MRNREAARYARGAAMAAGLIVLVVTGAYVERAIRQSRARHTAPPMVSVAVEHQSSAFSFKQEENGRTLFTVRASEETQFKDGGRAVLEDVWITVYGRDGNSNDNIHTHECSYEPETGAVRCAGEVQIDVQDAHPESAQPAGKPIEVRTRNLTFNRETGEASTPAPVEFSFPAGEGRGVGVVYSTHDATVRVEHAVEFDMAASERTGGLPVHITGSSLEILRKEHRVVLEGPVIARQGDRELSADDISVGLDSDFHAQDAVAEGHPALQAKERGAKFSAAAGKFEALLSPAGWIERVIADGNVTGSRQTSAGTDHFSASRVEFAMLPERNLIKDMTAGGGVDADSQQNGNFQLLKTDALRVTFAPGRSTDQQRVESAETLAPATIESKTGDEDTQLRAKEFVAQVGAKGRLEKLLGHSGVEVRRQVGKAAPQSGSAEELAATFAAGSAWATLDESGNVRLQQDDRQVTAARARVVRSTGVITLDGSPVLSDSMSRSTARSVVINQESGEISATGGVVSTYLPTSEKDAISLGSGAAHISSDTLSGSNASGHVVYAGHARIWQGDSVLDAAQIELWRDKKMMQATGEVVAVFPQASGSLAMPSGKPSALQSSGNSGPTLWKVCAPTLTYWSDLGKAHLEGGVTASSSQGSLESRTLDVFLAPAGATTATPTGAAGSSIGGARQLDRVLAQGGVVVRQGDRRAMAEQAEYTAADEKFVLSGGDPSITDAGSDTTTGHSLTFFVANDTILIDSQNGSRTLTKHRVEK